MKETSRLKRVLKRMVLWPVICLLVLLVALYYLLVFRFKDSLRFVISKETHGRYAFEAGRAELSLRNKSIALKSSSIRCQDTTGAEAYYDIDIPGMYFSLASWKELLFNGKVMADSLSLTAPAFTLHTRQHKTRQQHGSFHAGDILTVLNKTLARFNARSFSLQGGTFALHRTGSAQPLTVNNIDLSVINFTGVNNEDSHLLGSDKVAFSLGPQHWRLPEGKQEISFRALTFTSEGQRFEIDSLTYLQPPVEGKGEMMIQADKFLFNARHLPALYQKEQLLIDTLVCVNPVLTLPAGGHSKERDHLAAIPARHPLFRLINVKYISVMNGELRVKGQGQQQALTGRRANLGICNLSVDPARTPQVSIDSVRMDLQQLTFVSKDSLWQLGVEEFSFGGNGVLFKNVRYGPTAANHHKKGVVFTAPALELRNVDIGALLAKRLVATDAELVQPAIQLYNKGQQAPGVTSAGSKTNVFYQTLHGISQLIHVDNFRISNGSVQLHATGKKPLALSVQRLNAHILLHKLFLSDSLVDIKHAIPDLRMGQLHLTAGHMKISVDHYRFDGRARRNWSRELQVTLPAATLRGRDIYWEVFDWDIYQQTKEIQVNYLRLGSLDVRAHGGGHAGKAAQHQPLPVIRLYKLEVDQLAFEQSSPGTAVHLSGNKLYADGISTTGHFFSWNKLAARLRNISVKTKQLEAGIAEIQFSNQGESQLRNIELMMAAASGKTSVRLPLLRLEAPVHSTNMKALRVPFLQAVGASLRLQQASAEDTLAVVAEADLEAKDVRPGKDAAQLLQFNAATVALRNASVDKGGMHVQLPQTRLQLQDGRLEKDHATQSLRAASLELNWNNASVKLDNDSSALAASQLTGSLHIPAFSSSAITTAGSWKQLLNKLSLTGGEVTYRNKNIHASIGTTHWEPATQTLSLSALNVTPVLNREETFRKAQWQGNYMRFAAAGLTVAGIRPGSAAGDPLLYIRRMVLDSMALEVSRDKSLPFRHGTEKPMPTQLLRSLGIPLRIDTVAFANGAVAYHERKTAAGSWGSIPLQDINGTLLNVSSRGEGRDSLLVAASAKVFNGRIQELRYRESYADSLSGFTASLRLLPLELPAIGRMAMPNSPVSITSGATDTVYSWWSGNKYAAYGNMHFFYHDLQVRVHNWKHPGRGGILPAVATWAANLVLPHNKRKPSLIFFERDRERFIFNYWIKAQTRGVMSAIGIKSNRSYRKQYRRRQPLYSLPPGNVFDGNTR